MLKIQSEIESELILEILERNHKLRFQALGNSMFPSIRSGDFITVKPVSADEISLNDVIFFQNEGKFFAHRLIEKREKQRSETFITKGDFQSQADRPIDQSQLLGKIIKVERNGNEVNFDSNFKKKLFRLTPFYIVLFRLFLFILSLFRKVLIVIDALELKLNSLRIYRSFKKMFNTNFKCFRASASDSSLIADYYQVSDKDISGEIAKDAFYIVAKNNNKLLGALKLSKGWELLSDDKYWIMGFSILPRYRGRGIGHRLLQKTILELEKEEVKEVFVNVFQKNTAALRLYEKCGFEYFHSPEKTKEINEYFNKISPESGESLILYYKII